MNIRIIAEDDRLTESEQQRLQQASAHIPRYFRDIVSVEWHVSRQGRARVVSCMVHSRSGYYRAQVGSEVTEEAIGQALDKNRPPAKAPQSHQRDGASARVARRGVDQAPGIATAALWDALGFGRLAVDDE